MIFNFYWQHPRTWNHLIHSQNRSVPSSIFNRALRRGRNQNLSEYLLSPPPANLEENEKETDLSVDPQRTEQVMGTGRAKTGKTV